MAQINLHDSETYRDRLPNVCMMCGEPAVDHIRKNFSWCPPWVGILFLFGALPYILVASILTKRMLVEVPVCDRHRGYWWKRALLTFLPIALIGASGLGIFLLVQEAGNKDAAGLVCFGTIVFFVIGLIVAAVIQSLMIRPTEITGRSITLKGVHESFATAVSEMQDERRNRRRRYDEYEDDDRPLRRPSARADYDERPPRDRRTDIRPKDDFEE